MKKLLVLFLVLNCAFIYSQSDSLRKKWIEELNEKFEKNCKKDSEKASIDSKIKTLYYINVPAPDGEEFLQEKEFAKILSEENITFGGLWMGSDISGYYTDSLCYKSSMTRYAEAKFGKEFFKNKKLQALEIFIKENPNRIFHNYEDLDRDFVIKQQDILNKEFWVNFSLPKDYVIRKAEDYYSYAIVDFVIDKNGEMTDLRIDIKLQNPKNEQFKPLIENQIIKTVRKIKWLPNNYKGFIVKSEFSPTLGLP
ncbi:energy transducer TonB [Epilithonimonas xixisoli]|uniref:Uncharacterized protein n=1 Tax=Epilithonimonas xixisoli TaxID=1476462 RepID=A0A4V3H2Q6_9FLAO|nr:hypothetical protein [Epilithonimonas xixisoli]TDX84846.1 hypothetical protein B0I22_2484 [Epilithonimonas xixisoli]